MKEIRIFVADLSTWYSSSSDLDTIIECAESQGTTYTLAGFCKAHEEGEIKLDGDSTLIRACVMEDGNFVCEVEPTTGFENVGTLEV